jgi:hypothetical protein
MSELTVNPKRNDFYLHLLSTVSALSLVAILSARAEAGDKPTVWIELGGQLERIDGSQDPFLPPFTALSPAPGPYSPVSPAEAQRPSIYSYGAKGKIAFRPGEGDWTFAATVRYGRSNSKKRLHQQTYVQRTVSLPGGPLVPLTHLTISAPIFADYQTRNDEAHTIVDFSAGKDVGLGLWGRQGTSQISAGIRFADFESKSSARIMAQPQLIFHDLLFLGKYHIPIPNHYNYFSTNEASRSFKGVGPSLSWDASASIFGDPENAQVTLDWGLNAAILFGRQKAAGKHSVEARYYVRTGLGKYYPQGAQVAYNHATPHNRSRSVVVPNIGGIVGLSVRYPNAKVSLGYRADFFFGAMDGGIDARKTYDRNFYGPFANISIGLGG